MDITFSIEYDKNKLTERLVKHLPKHIMAYDCPALPRNGECVSIVNLIHKHFINTGEPYDRFFDDITHHIDDPYIVKGIVHDYYGKYYVKVFLTYK